MPDFCINTTMNQYVNFGISISLARLFQTSAHAKMAGRALAAIAPHENQFLASFQGIVSLEDGASGHA